MTRQDLPVSLVIEKLKSPDGIWRPVVTELRMMPVWQRIAYRIRVWMREHLTRGNVLVREYYPLHKLQTGLDFAIEANQDVINVLLTPTDKRHYNVIIDKDDIERVRMVLIPTQELLRRAIMEDQKGKNPAV